MSRPGLDPGAVGGLGGGSGGRRGRAREGKKGGKGANPGGAEPTPALPSGRTARMAPVDGAVTRPSPTAIITMEARTGPKYALSLPRVEAMKKPAPISIRPAGTTILVPRRRAKTGAAGAAAPTPRAKGSVRRPAERGL